MLTNNEAGCVWKRVSVSHTLPSKAWQWDYAGDTYHCKGESLVKEMDTQNLDR